MSGQGRALAVVGARGGVGATFCAVNLAAAAAAKGGRTLLLDASWRSFSAAALALGLKQSRDFAAVAREPGLLERKGVEDALTRHRSGLSFLRWTDEVVDRRGFDAAAAGRALAALLRAFPQAIVDISLPLNETAVEILDQCHALLIVVTPDVASVKAAEELAESVRQLHFPHGFTRFVLNRSHGGSAEEIMVAHLKRELLAALPEDLKAVPHSLDKGEPLVLSAPNSVLGRQIVALGAQLAGEAHARRGRTAATKPPPGGEERTQIFSKAQLLQEQQRLQDASKPAPQLALHDIKHRVHTRLLEELDLRKLDFAQLGSEDEKAKDSREKIKQAIVSIIDEGDFGITSRSERMLLAVEVFDEAVGLGPLEKIMRDPDVTEIMVNGKDEIFVEKQGKLMQLPDGFISDAHLRGVIERIVAPIGRRIDERTPMVDARLADGSRVNAIIPPLSLGGPLLTIRRFSRNPYSADNLVDFGSISRPMVTFLEAAVRARRNILVSGGTGTGKTTLLNVLSFFIPEGERIVTIEDSAELRLSQKHVLRLEARPKNIEGEGEVAIRDLVRNALRMRPDRIVVGECRSGEAIDMLQAMNTGHDGSLTTIHANSPKESMSRLEVLVLFAGFDLPSRAIREQIANAINIVVQIGRFPDGTRKIVSVTEVSGIEGGEIRLEEIFRFRQTGSLPDGSVQGCFSATGYRPAFVDTLSRKGIILDPQIFAPPQVPS